MTDERNKYLVIEDDTYAIRAFDNHKSGLFDVAATKNRYFSLETGEELLRTQPYQAILLDGHLGCDLEGEYFDGGVVARRIRNGQYGELNRETPFYSISSEMEFADDIGAVGRLAKPEESWEVDGIVKRLEKDQ